MNPAPDPHTATVFIHEGSVWLFLLAAMVGGWIGQAILMGMRAVKRRPRRARRQARVGARHAAPLHPWRGEIPPTWLIPVVTEAFPAAHLAEGW
jgi:hypothetical protein